MHPDGKAENALTVSSKEKEVILLKKKKRVCSGHDNNISMGVKNQNSEVCRGPVYFYYSFVPSIYHIDLFAKDWY